MGRYVKCLKKTVVTSVEMAEVCEQLIEYQDQLALPSEDCIEKAKDYLVSIKSRASFSNYVEQESTAAQNLLNANNSWKLDAFISIIWYQAYTAIRDHIVENADDDSLIFNLQRQHFTEATARMHAFFTDIQFFRYLCAIFTCNEQTMPQRSVAVQLAKEIYFIFLRHLASLMTHHKDSSVVDFDVQAMSPVGRSKVCHVGGLAVRKILTRYRKYVQANMFSNNSSTMVNVHKRQKLCNLLEENIIVPFAKLEETSKYPETLDVTEARQYRERGLLHISDEAYIFFMALEEQRVKFLNMHRLKEANGEKCHGGFNKR